MSINKTLDDIYTKALEQSKEIQHVKPSPFNRQEHEDKTRSKLALIFVWGYFIVLGIAIVLVLINNIVVDALKLSPDIIINVKDIISTISGAIGISLGFVVGYYFKSSEKSENYE